jgi:hypothetical protein
VPESRIIGSINRAACPTGGDIEVSIDWFLPRFKTKVGGVFLPGSFFKDGSSASAAGTAPRFSVTSPVL